MLTECLWLCIPTRLAKRYDQIVCYGMVCYGALWCCSKISNFHVICSKEHFRITIMFFKIAYTPAAYGGLSFFFLFFLQKHCKMLFLLVFLQCMIDWTELNWIHIQSSRISNKYEGNVQLTNTSHQATTLFFLQHQTKIKDPTLLICMD